ncbi:MAG: ATP-binding cassette domain-containing protein, partial [Alphaproteobacteria bacterium]
MPADDVPARDVIVSVKDLKVAFPVHGGVLGGREVGSVKAVDGINFDIRRGETLGVVGESGCGKSTTGLAILRLIDLSAGRVIFDGTDISTFDRAQMRPLRRQMQMIYQDPFGSLNPRMRVKDIVGEPLIAHGLAENRRIYREQVAALLDVVGLTAAMGERYPHEFSGGQRQRIGIARALAVRP